MSKKENHITITEPLQFFLNGGGGGEIYQFKQKELHNFVKKHVQSLLNG